MTAHVDPADINSIGLCAGVGMLDVGVDAGLRYLGYRSRYCLHAEWEAYPCAAVAARMEEGALAAAPIWFGDFTRLPAAALRGVVDLVVAGFPCQDLSVAGRRAGLDGKRSGLFFDILDAADACGARGLFLENVDAIATATASVVDAQEGELDERAVARVLGELADRGWDAEWCVVSAADVGASHGRSRWFCLAWRRVDDAARHGWTGSGDGAAQSGRRIREAGLALDDADHDGRRVCRLSTAGQRQGCADPSRASEGLDGLAVADSDGCIGSGAGQFNARRRPDVSVIGVGLADTGEPRLPVTESEVLRQPWWWREGRATAELRGPPLFAPGPGSREWAAILEHSPWLAPALSIEEQHDAQAAAEAPQPLFRGVANGLAPRLDFTTRAQRLRCVGNGVVPLQAALAFVVCARRAELFPAHMTETP